jgi:hypothetical protein
LVDGQFMRIMLETGELCCALFGLSTCMWCQNGLSVKGSGILGMLDTGYLHHIFYAH